MNELNLIAEAYEIMCYGKSDILTEAVHKEIQDIMDSDSIQPKNKLNAVTKKARELMANGQDTGMESDKPKKGSSRAVFFPKEQKEITVDGVKTKSPTAVKIAFPGQLDKYHGDESLLGEDQNRKESDHYINSQYGILRHERGEYHSSSDESGGVLAPVFETHSENHHLEMGRVEKATAKGIKEATTTKEFPRGLTHGEIYQTLVKQHQDAHGQKNDDYASFSSNHLDKVSTHPWVEHATSMMHDSEMDPRDLQTRNMGIYTHPVTGKKHLAIIDYGFDAGIGKKYAKARKVMCAKNRNY